MNHTQNSEYNLEMYKCTRKSKLAMFEKKLLLSRLFCGRGPQFINLLKVNRRLSLYNLHIFLLFSFLSIKDFLGKVQFRHLVRACAYNRLATISDGQKNFFLEILFVGFPKSALSSQTQYLISALTSSNAIYQKNHQKFFWENFFAHLALPLGVRSFKNF